MPNVYKVREHLPSGDILLYHSSADIVALDEDKGLGDNLESAITLLNEKAEGKANTTTFKATILASAFEGTTSPYTQKITVEGILETDNPVVGVVFDDNTSLALKQRDAWGSVHRITCMDDEITVYCFEDKPLIDIPIQLKVIR